MIRAPLTGIALTLVVLALITPTAIPAASPSRSTNAGPVPRASPLWGPSNTHIQHIITVILENHVYDSLFGSYCLNLGAYCSDTGNGPAPGTCVPRDLMNASRGCVPLFNFTAAQFVTPDMQHDWVSAPEAYDNGTNGGFYTAEHNTTEPFGEYNASTVPIYWDLAEEYALGDNFFAANLSYSLPNHWDLLAGQAPNISYDSYLKSGSDRVSYLREANATPSIQDLLNGTNVTWKYYDYPLSPYNSSIRTYGWNTAYDYWNPLAGRGESYTPWNTTHFAARTDLIGDVQNGTLPNLSWVVPAANESNHPGYNLSLGEDWVSQLVDLVENSSYWGSTAIFVLWDDYGGWYDHVVPPTELSDGLSFRSPLLVISPYARENYISHEFVDFYSILHYEEWTFGLGCLTTYDCGAPLPFDFFDYNGTARSPLLFPTVWNQASYPAPLQSPGAGDTLCPNCGRLTWPSWDGANLPPGTPGMGD